MAKRKRPGFQKIVRRPKGIPFGPITAVQAIAEEEAKQEKLEDYLSASPALQMATSILDGLGKNPAKKGAPSLADQIMVDSYKVPGQLTQISASRLDLEKRMLRYRIALRKANRFFLDDELTAMATEVSATTTPEQLLQRLHSAVVPYETTWLEFNLHVKVQKTIDMNTSPPKTMEGVSPVMGVLIQRDFSCPTAFAVTLFNRQVPGVLTVPEPIVYLFDAAQHPGRVAGYKAMDEFIDKKAGSLTLKMLEATGFGYTTGDAAADEHLAVLAYPSKLQGYVRMGMSELYQNFTLHDFGDRSKNREMVRLMAEDYITAAKENTGTLRWVITVLAMLAEVPMRKSEHVLFPGSHLLGTQRKSYMDFHRLRLQLPKTKPLSYITNTLDKGEARRHRAHEVRSHWRTYVEEWQDKCPHVWEYDHGNGYRLCGKCMAYGRLIKEHVRGDASLGWVRKDYVLEKNHAA